MKQRIDDDVGVGKTHTEGASCILRADGAGKLEVVSVTAAFAELLALAGAPLDATAGGGLPEELSALAREAARRGGALQTEVLLGGMEGRWLTAVVSEAGRGVVACTLVDISEHKRTERALRRRQREFEAIVENAPDIIARIDREFRHAYVNLAIEEATGRAREEFIGKDHAELGMPQELVGYFQSVYREVFETGREGRKEFEFPSPQGVRSYSSRVVPERGPDGRVETVLSVARDVTDHKRALSERLEMERRLSGRQRLESLGLLAGGVAHDFNNLLQTVLGTASLVRHGMPAEDPARGDLEQIENACLQASELCRQLLTYAGQQSSSTEVVDIEEVVAETHPLLQLSVSKKVTLHFQRRGDLPPVRADASQLRQVVMNLVLNAAEAIAAGDGRVELVTDVVSGDDPCFGRLHLAPEARAEQYVRLQVTDEGCGMDADTLQRIFEPFFSTKFAGRGLGLAATIGIVRGHDGGIGVRSTPGGGTTFEVLFPATEGRPSRSVPIADPAEWRTEGTLLVVDDQDAVRHTAARLAEDIGFRTLLARDGLEALELLELHAGRVDAVLLDLTMPRLDGPETLERIRHRTKTLPVILMSGHTEADVAELTRGGMTAFLRKPFRAAQLIETLRRALEPE